MNKKHLATIVLIAIPLLTSASPKTLSVLQNSVLVGVDAGYHLITGTDDVCVGYHACYDATHASHLRCIGAYSCAGVTTEDGAVDLRGCPDSNIVLCKEYIKAAIAKAMHP